MSSTANPGSLPIYMQIAEMIAREVVAGKLLEGEKLPPEREMASQYNVTVTTLRKSLKQLTEQGLLEKRQGSGNYVRVAEQPMNIYAFFRLESLHSKGFPTAELLSLDKMQKPNDLPQFGKSEIGFRFRRIRYLDDRAAALEEIWLDGGYINEINKRDVSDSLYLFYKRRLGHWITRVEDQVTISSLPDWQVDQFGLKGGSACGYVERRAWNQLGDEMEFSRNWFDPNEARYISRLK